MTHDGNPLYVFQVVSNGLLLLCGNLVGYFYVHSTASGHQQTVERTKSCVESRVKLECEKEHQEQLLLSVIPAYIAAEVLLLLDNLFSGLKNVTTGTI